MFWLGVRRVTWGREVCLAGEPRGIDVQSTVKIRGPMLLVNV